jgi:hypothetical protein
MGHCSHLFIIFIIFTLIHSSENQTSTETYLRVRSVTCGSSMKTVVDLKCFLRSTKTDACVNVQCLKKRKTKDANWAFRIERISGDYSNKILDVKDISICPILEGVKKSSIPFIQHMVDYVRKKDTNFLDFCSIENSTLYANNVSLKDFTMAKFLPLGLYAIYHRFYDNFDNQIFASNGTLSNIRKIKKN